MDQSLNSAHMHTFLLDGQGLGKNKTEKVMRKTFWGRSMQIDPSKWVKDVKILVSHVNAHQIVTSAEEFRNQEVEMTPSVDRQALSPVILTEWGMTL